MASLFIIPNLHSTAQQCQICNYFSFFLQVLINKNMFFPSIRIFFFYLVSNSIIYLNTQYVGTSQARGVPQVALRRSFEFKCEYTGSDADGEFVDWFKEVNGQNISVSVDKPGHYVVKHNTEDSTLQIKIFGKEK